MVAVSVVIPSYNSRRTIRECLHALTHQDYPHPIEIIVVDSSDDGTEEIIQTEFPEVTCIHLPRKTDPGTGRRLGVERSQGKLILFIDSDCVAPPDWVSRYVALHQKYPNVAAIGGAVVNGNPPNILTSWAGYIAEFREFLPQQPGGFVRHLPTLNISYKRWVFQKYGFFDPRLYPQEDLVFNYRLVQNGEKILFDPSIVVRHKHNPSLKAFLRHQKNIGRITAIVLRLLPLEGSTIARNKLLYFLFAPLLPIVKFFRTLVVFIRKAPNILYRHPGAVFIFAIGLGYWLIGFTTGVLTNLEPFREASGDYTNVE